MWTIITPHHDEGENLITKLTFRRVGDWQCDQNVGIKSSPIELKTSPKVFATIILIRWHNSK